MMKLWQIPHRPPFPVAARALTALLTALLAVPLITGCAGPGDDEGDAAPATTEAPAPEGARQSATDSGDTQADGPGDDATGGAPATPCAELENLIERTLCYVDRAQAAGSTAPCDEAGEKAVRGQCYAIYASRVGDPDPCRRLPTDTEDDRDLRDLCLSDVAEATSEAALCAEISAPGLRDSCYLKVFRQTGDATLCDEIGDPNLASLCTGEPHNVE